MTTPEILATQVDLFGLMTVLGEHLYSTPFVALRELVQNAHDSCVRRRLEDPAAFAPEIRVVCDPAAGTLAVSDAGAGLTRDEIVRYLATIGAGYTRKLREQHGSDDLIGLFGLGFLSAFVIATRVAVTTTSYQSPDTTLLYQSRSGERFSIEPAASRPVGTTVTLHLKDNFRELSDESALRARLLHYCALLPLPVFVGDDDVAVNAQPAPWRVPDAHPARARTLRLDFARRLERRFEPLCTIDVGPREGTDVRGLLWIHDAATYGTSDNRNLHVYVRGMLLDDDARELLPPWAGFVSGAIESAKLTPTASREDLQRDPAYRAVAAAIAEALVDGMKQIAEREPEAWRRVLLRHNEALLGAALCDDRLFELLADELTVPTSEGDLPIAVVQRRGQGKLYASLSPRGGFEEVLFRALRVPVVVGTRYGALPFVRRHADRRGGAVIELGTAAGNKRVFPPADLPADQQAFLSNMLTRPGQRLIAARFAPAELPLVLVPDREAELKRRVESDEAAGRIASGALGLMRMFTAKIDASVDADLYVNLDNPAIVRLLEQRASIDAGHPGVKLLRALVAFVAGASEAAANEAEGLHTALAEYGRAVCELLDTPRPAR
ncbi:molecular chaperone HtpG [Nannocystis exedens]|uniref:Molecular chaperone HtpG n=1 Tax=Nannocystis exedens TaxID=54 RepID=A0A1I2D8B7_9BACT|nr:ATP-binding protein [Nannocystis exedens]PCC70666.1 histidine kinase [Nannocystis exedens]SFE76744.1 molecular chaperone HtpG [Nannocystis exedens]